MTRMGHDSPRAAMIYQHATTVEDRAIADRLSGLVKAHPSSLVTRMMKAMTRLGTVNLVGLSGVMSMV